MLLDPMATNDWNKLLRSSQNLLRWRYMICPDLVFSQLLQHAKQLCFFSVMSETVDALEAGRLRELNVQNENGIIVIKGRAPLGMRKFLDKEVYPLL